MHYLNFLLIFTLTLISSNNAFAQFISTEETSKLFEDLKNNSLKNDKKTFILSDSSKVELTYYEGLANGNFKIYYKSGKSKAKGKLHLDNPIGKWTIKTQKPFGKIVRKYNYDQTFSYIKSKSGFLKYNIIFGHGKTKYRLSERDFPEQYFVGSQTIRKTQKEGEVIEKFENGKIRAKYTLKNFKPEHKLEIFFNNGKPRITAYYNNGLAVGEHRIYNKNGELEVSRDYTKNPFVARMPNHIFYGNWDVYDSKRELLAIPLWNKNNEELGITDSLGVSIYSILESAFKNDETVFFQDENFSTPLFPTSTMPDLASRITTNTKEIKSVMIYLLKDSYLSFFRSDKLNAILGFSLAISYTDELGNTLTACLPWTYFPEMYHKLKDKKINNNKLEYYFEKMLNDEYYSIIIKSFDNQGNEKFNYFKETNPIEKSDLLKLEWLNKTINFWLSSTIILE